MTRFGDLNSHAERCEQLASVCTDQATTMKFRRLAKEYRDLAKQSKTVTPVLVITRCPLCGTSRPECDKDRAGQSLHGQ
jgi:hypothetical protein